MTDVGLKIGLMEISSSMVTLTFFECKQEWSRDEFEGKITYFLGAKDNFMVHDVNKLLININSNIQFNQMLSGDNFIQLVIKKIQPDMAS